MKLKTFIGLLGFFIFILGSRFELAAQQTDLDGEIRPHPIGVVEDLEASVAAYPDPSESGLRQDTLIWEREFNYPGSQQIRLHFAEIAGPESAAFAVIIEDLVGQVLEYDGAQFLAQSEFWSDIVAGGYARVTLVASVAPENLRFRIDAVARQVDLGVSLSIVGNDEREHIVEYRGPYDIKSVEKAIAKLDFIVGRRGVVCSGFLVSEDLLVTNHHCIADQHTCDTAVAVFGYQLGSDLRRQQGQQYRCVRVVDTDWELDYSVLALAGRPGDIWGWLQLTERDVGEDEPIYIVQHPAGEPKQVSASGCIASTPIAVGRGRDTDFGHKCDTMGGSSGSPVLDAQGKVIGLHHFGFSGGRWADENRAVRMVRILERSDLRRNR